MRSTITDFYRGLKKSRLDRGRPAVENREHEAVGEVVEVGRGVCQLKRGDRVMMPAAVGCGACGSCRSGDVIHCANNAGGCYGLSAKLQGVQAEAGCRSVPGKRRIRPP